LSIPVANSDSFRQIVVFPEIYVFFRILLCSVCELPKESKAVNGVLPLGPKWPIATLGEGFFLGFLVSPVRLFCYVIKGKQVQKSVNLAANAGAKVGRH